MDEPSSAKSNKRAKKKQSQQPSPPQLESDEDIEAAEHDALQPNDDDIKSYQLTSFPSIERHTTQRAGFGKGAANCCKGILWRIFETLASSWINLGLALFAFVIMGWIFNWPAEATFLLALGSMIATSSLVDFAVLQFEESAPKVAGKVYHLVFSHSNEMFVAILATVRGAPRVGQALLLGTVLNRLALSIGFGLLNGWRLNAIKVDNKNLKAVATVALIVLFAWVSPGIFASSTDAQYGEAGLLRLSRWDAILLLIGCVMYMIFTLKSHPTFYKLPQTDNTAGIGLVAAIIAMVPILVVVIINAWLFAGSVEVVGNRWGLTQTFIGMVIIPLALNTIHLVNVLRLSNAARSMDTLFTNLLRLIIDLGLFTVPVVIIGAWIGQYPLGLDYRVFELVFGLALAFLVRFIVTDLRTNWFVGGAMIVLYLIMCVSFFFHADD